MRTHAEVMADLRGRRDAVDTALWRVLAWNNLDHESEIDPAVGLEAAAEIAKTAGEPAAATWLVDAVAEANNDKLLAILAAVVAGDQAEAGRLLAHIVAAYGVGCLETAACYQPRYGDDRALEDWKEMRDWEAQ